MGRSSNATVLLSFLIISLFLSYKPDSEGEKVHLNQTVRVRRYTIGGNSHTVRTLPGYVLVCGGRRGGWHAVLSCMWRYSHMLFLPAFGVIPTCVFFSHMCNLFPSYHSCHCTIHAFVPSLSRSIPACSWSQRGEGCVCGPACYMRQKYTKKVV